MVPCIMGCSWVARVSRFSWLYRLSVPLCATVCATPAALRHSAPLSGPRPSAPRFCATLRATLHHARGDGRTQGLRFDIEWAWFGVRCASVGSYRLGFLQISSTSNHWVVDGPCLMGCSWVAHGYISGISMCRLRLVLERLLCTTCATSAPLSAPLSEPLCTNGTNGE